MNAILSELANARHEDTPFERILGSMCTPPHEIAQKAYAMFIETNLGDAELFKGTKKLESKAIDWVSRLIHAPHSAKGMMTSGGTEGNITALWLYKSLSTKNEVLIPQQAHFSFLKASSLLSLKTNRVNCNLRMTVKDLKKHVTDNTLCVVGITGNTPYGYIDDIFEIGEFCTDNHIYLHVDAAFGGFIAPFISNKKFDFRSHITSISLDSHKIGLSCIPSGFLFFDDSIDTAELAVQSHCTHTALQHGLLGTRPGASAASAYAVFRYLDYGGYETLAKTCMKTTYFLADLLKENAVDFMTPELNIVAIRAEQPVETAKKLAELNWFVGIDNQNKILRVVCMPHVTTDIIIKFVDDLQKVI